MHLKIRLLHFTPMNARFPLPKRHHFDCVLFLFRVCFCFFFSRCVNNCPLQLRTPPSGARARQLIKQTNKQANKQNKQQKKKKKKREMKKERTPPPSTYTPPKKKRRTPQFQFPSIKTCCGLPRNSEV